MAFTPIHFTEDDRIFRDQIRRFAEREVAPIADEIDHEDRFPAEVIPKFGDMGLLQWSVPEAYGGPEGSLTKLCIAREELARFSLSLSVMVGENGNGMALMTANLLVVVPFYPKLVSFLLKEVAENQVALEVKEVVEIKEGKEVKEKEILEIKKAAKAVLRKMK